MISIFFVPGMFGSTVEYVLRAYSKELSRIEKQTCCPDGSMHNFSRQIHAISMKDILKLSDQSYNSLEIITTVYPFRENHLPDIIVTHRQFSKHNDKNILIYSPDLRSAELNMLFQYYKVAFGHEVKEGLDVFCHRNQTDIVNWNQAYTHWSQMQPWELREWLSLLYVVPVNEWINSYHQVDDSFLKVKNTTLLNNPQQAIQQIAEFCNLTFAEDPTDFLEHWRQQQQYIVDEFECLDAIVNQTIDNWKPLSIIGEAIVQHRLKAKGFELRCHNLNVFPTDSDSLYKLLEKC